MGSGVSVPSPRGPKGAARTQGELLTQLGDLASKLKIDDLTSEELGWLAEDLSQCKEAVDAKRRDAMKVQPADSHSHPFRRVSLAMAMKTEMIGWEDSWGSAKADWVCVALVPRDVPMAVAAKRLPLERVLDMTASLGYAPFYDIVSMKMDDFIRSRGALMIGRQADKVEVTVHKELLGNLFGTTLSGTQNVTLPKSTLERCLGYRGLSTFVSLQHCNVSDVLRAKMFKLWPCLAREAIIPIGPPTEAAVRALAWRPSAFKELHACHLLAEELYADADSALVRCVAMCRGVFCTDPQKRVRRILQGGVFTRVSSGTRLLERLLIIVATCAATADLHFGGMSGGKPLPSNPAKAHDNLKSLFLDPLAETLRVEVDDIVATWQRCCAKLNSKQIVLGACFMSVLMGAKDARLQLVRNFIDAVVSYPKPNAEAVQLDALVAEELAESACEKAWSDFAVTMNHGRQRSRDDEIIRSYVIKTFKSPPSGSVALRDVIDHEEWRSATPSYYYVVRMSQAEAKKKGAMALSYRWKDVVGPLENVTMTLPGTRPFQSGGFFPIGLDTLQIDHNQPYWMDFLNHLNNPVLRGVSMQTMGTVYVAHPIEPAHAFQASGTEGLSRLWIYQEIAFGMMKASALDACTSDVSSKMKAFNDPSLQVSAVTARQSVLAVVECDATRESDRFHATLYTASVRLGMTLLPVGKPPVSEEDIDKLCDLDVGRYVRCIRVLRELLEIGGPYVYASSHQLPAGLKTLGLGFVDNGEWYALGTNLKARVRSTSRSLLVEVEPAASDEFLKPLNAFSRSGNVGGTLQAKSKFA